MPNDIGRCVCSFLDSLVTSISKCNRLVSMQECLSLGNVTDMPGCTSHRVHPAGLGIRSDVGLHATVPLVAFLAGVHVGITCPIFVLGGGGRGNQCGVHQSASFE